MSKRCTLVNAFSYFSPLHVLLTKPLTNYYIVMGYSPRSHALPWDIKRKRVTSKSDELFPIILWVSDCVTISMWEKHVEDVQSGYIKANMRSSRHIYEKLYPWWSTSQGDVPLVSQGCESAAWKLNATCARLLREVKSKNVNLRDFFYVQVKWALWTVNASLLVVLLFSHALCIIGRFEVEKNQVGQQFWEIKELHAFEAKTTLFCHSKAGRFSKASLITNCRHSFIYKPQSFYWKSEALISCLPLLGHHHEQGSREEEGCRRFILFSC